jgi:hypothetical protein
MFAATFKMSPLKFLKEMYDLDEAAKRDCGIWDDQHSPQHDSYVTRDVAIKEEYWFVFYIHTTMKMSPSSKVGGFGAGVQQST